jgi:L-iditol 2-dehydrogenase
VCDLLRTTHFEPGGFAEYIRVPKINVELGTLRIPDAMTFDEGSFIEPLACVVRAQRFAKLATGQTVLVIGSGISGLLHIQLAKARGADRIIATDISEYRLNAARRLFAPAPWRRLPKRRSRLIAAARCYCLRRRRRASMCRFRCSISGAMKSTW